MFGKKLSDINTKKNHKSDYFSKSGLIAHNKNYSFYMKKKLEGFFNSTNEYFLLEFNDRNYNQFNYYRIKPNNNFLYKKNLIYFLFSKNKIFLKKSRSKTIILNKHKIQSIKNKYWGSILTLFNSKKLNLAAKIIYMNKNTQSSLEYHLNKSESYFILDGKLTLGLRYGRAKQSILNLNKYNSFDMSPGIMHMRIAKLNSVIVEVSSFDDDSDSNIVEDGKKFKFSLR